MAFSSSPNVDKKAKAAFELGGYYWTIRKLSDAKMWFRTCLRVMPVATDSNNVVDAQNLLANVYLNEAAYDSALFFCNESFSSIGKISNKRLLPNLYQTKGRIYLPLGDQNAAINFFTVADSLYETSPDILMQSQSPYIKIALGQIFESQQQMNRAKEYYDMAVRLSGVQKDINTMATSLQTEAQWFCTMKQYKKAKEIYAKLLQPPLHNAYSYRIIYIFNGLGDVYLGLRQPDSSLYYFKKSLQESKDKGENYRQDLFYCKMGNAYTMKKMFSLAKLYYDSTIQTAEKNRYRSASIMAYQGLAEIAIDENDYKAAYRYLQTKQQLKDSVLNLKTVEMSNHSYTLNNIKQKDVTINALTVLDEDNQKLIKQGKVITSLLFAFTGLLLLFFFIFTKRLKLARRLEKQMIITEERERIIADLHDDAGATISSIHIYSELAGSLVDTKPHESKELLAKISQQGKDLLNRMSDIIWSLKPGNEQSFSISSRLKNYSHELLASKGINVEFEISETLDSDLSNPLARKNILLIMKEAMNNVAKYSGANNAVITLQQAGESIQLSVKDNGKGFNIYATATGNGLHNMKQRSKYLKGEFNIISSPEHGTLVSVKFPIAIISHTT
ncbi:MAG: histidine kinase [Bacteroidota bacterium]